MLCLQAKHGVGLSGAASGWVAEARDEGSAATQGRQRGPFSGDCLHSLAMPGSFSDAAAALLAGCCSMHDACCGRYCWCQSNKPLGCCSQRLDSDWLRFVGIGGLLMTAHVCCVACRIGVASPVAPLRNSQWLCIPSIAFQLTFFTCEEHNVTSTG